jgi:hypothetical protein
VVAAGDLYGAEYSCFHVRVFDSAARIGSAAAGRDVARLRGDDDFVSRYLAVAEKGGDRSACRALASTAAIRDGEVDDVRTRLNRRLDRCAISRVRRVVCIPRYVPVPMDDTSRSSIARKCAGIARPLVASRAA